MEAATVTDLSSEKLRTKSFVDSGSLEGIAICRGGSHLFFADDSLIFCKATLANCESLQRILEVFEKASSEQLNRAKTSLFFSSKGLVPKLLNSMRSILAYHLLWVETKGVLLMP